MKKFLALAMLFVVCGCENNITIVEYGNQIKKICIPNEQTIESIDYNVNSSNSIVTVKWKVKDK